MNQKTVLVTFGAGSTGWKSAARRIKRDAIKAQIFSEVANCDEKWLKKFDLHLWQTIESYLVNDEKRGFGYWMWKPALLKWADEQWPNHQILYVDAGFHIFLDKKMIVAFKDFLEKSYSCGGIAFEQHGLQEISWTKREIFDYFEISEEEKLNFQIYAGFILLPPGQKRRDIISEFYSLTKKDNGYLFNDNHDINQHFNFIETRHDQSIYSILCRKYNLATISDLTAPVPNPRFMFIAARNRTGLSATTNRHILKIARGLNRIRDWQNCDL